MGPFESVRVKVVDDTLADLGRSAARNQGVKASEADWLFFLDADDLIHPSAFVNFNRIDWSLHDGVWGLISEYVMGCIVERYQVRAISTYAELLRFSPPLALQIGHFVRREVAAEHPFAEDMDTGEDWKYYLELWEKRRCVKVPYAFYVNERHRPSTGPRAATGKEWNQVVQDLVVAAREERGAAQ
jgi:glycosyltransferase involved in cell wall biosynthesis